GKQLSWNLNSVNLAVDQSNVVWMATGNDLVGVPPTGEVTHFRMELNTRSGSRSEFEIYPNGDFLIPISDTDAHVGLVRCTRKEHVFGAVPQPPQKPAMRLDCKRALGGATGSGEPALLAPSVGALGSWTSATAIAPDETLVFSNYHSAGNQAE